MAATSPSAFPQPPDRARPRPRIDAPRRRLRRWRRNALRRAGPGGWALRRGDREREDRGRDGRGLALRRRGHPRRPHRRHDSSGHAGGRPRPDAHRRARHGGGAGLHRHPGAVGRLFPPRGRAGREQGHPGDHHGDPWGGLDARPGEPGPPRGGPSGRRDPCRVGAPLRRAARLPQLARGDAGARHRPERRVVRGRRDRAHLCQARGDGSAHARRARHHALRGAARDGGRRHGHGVGADLPARQLRHHGGVGRGGEGDGAVRRRLHLAHALGGGRPARGDGRGDPHRAGRVACRSRSTT